MTLEEHLCAYDGKTIAILEEARVACGHSADFPAQLISLCFDARPSVSDGATWILNAELEDGAELSGNQTSYVIKSLEKLHSWQAMLHLCQGAALLDLSPQQAERFVVWALPLCDHSRPFLRAWSIHSIVNLSRKFDFAHKQASCVLKQGLEDPAGSVRARARKLDKG